MMGKISFFIVLLGIFLSPAVVFGVNCDHLTTPQDVLDCAEQNHPDLQVARATLSQGTALESLARQRPNPELTHRALWGKSDNASYRYAEFNLAHTVELGNKRASRLEQASAEQQKRRTDMLKVREEVYLDTLLTLVRLRQLQEEVQITAEALESYQRIEKQFKARPRLSPEQQVSLSIFGMAQNDYITKQTLFEAETLTLSREMERAIGRPFEAKSELLPLRHSSWPSLLSSTTPIKGSGVQMADAEVHLAKAQVETARGMRWPDLKVGPSFEVQKQGSQNLTALGDNVAVSLPLYHRNAGGQAYANEGLRKTELTRQAVYKEALDQRDIWTLKYQGAVKALHVSMAPQTIAQKHEEMERLFDRGLIPVSLLLEAHRQRLEWMKSQHEQELTAIEALGRVRALNGQLFEEGL